MIVFFSLNGLSGPWYYFKWSYSPTWLGHLLLNTVLHPKSTLSSLIFAISTIFYFFSFVALLSLLHNLEFVTLQPINPTTVSLSINPLISLTSSFRLESMVCCYNPSLYGTTAPLPFSLSDSLGKTLTLIECNSTCPERFLRRRLW